MTPLSDSEAATVARFENAEPAPESWGGGLREAIAVALANSFHADAGPLDLRAADALLPVVTAWAEQRARERAAEELRAAADWLAAGAAGRPGPLRLIARKFHDRAAALAADVRTGQR